jgi:hypothetical protein
MPAPELGELVCEVLPAAVELDPSQIAPPEACELRADAGGLGGVIFGRAAVVRTPAGFAGGRARVADLAASRPSFPGSAAFTAASVFSASTGVFVGSLPLTKRCCPGS